MHYSVLVVGDCIEDQLAPFQENNMGDCPDEYLEFVTEISLEEAEREWKKEQKKGETIDDYIKRVYGYETQDGGEGYGYYTNPDSKWDWYVLGGRWQGSFTLKSGLPADKAFKKDIDFIGMRKNGEKTARKNWSLLMGEKNKLRRLTGERELRAKLGIKQNETKEEYFSRLCDFSTYAILKDGEWLDKDNFPTEKDWLDEYQNILKGIDKNEMLSVVDCHC